MFPTLAVSFVHGYSDLNYQVETTQMPALWAFDSQGNTAVHKYPFPRTASDFFDHKDIILGSSPSPGVKPFKKLPRFGLTGLAESGNHLFAGSWNGVYRIRKQDFRMENLITNNLMNDLHGIYVDEAQIITILTGKDTVVISDHDGNVVEHFSVANDLSIYTDRRLEDFDWRFLSKQFRGATGLWHFNYVQKFGDEIWLTARNIGAFVVVNVKTKKAHIRSINHKTVSLVHDGLLHRGEHFFTSIDGKIIIAAEAASATFEAREVVESIADFSRDMVSEVLRLDETEFGYEPNWCRGIECVDDQMFITVDGRYDTDLSFGLLGLTRTGERVFERRLRWEDVGSEKDLRYVTGFDVLAL